MSISQDSPLHSTIVDSPKGVRIKVALALLITQAALQSCSVISYFEGGTPQTPQTGPDSGISAPLSPYDHRENSASQEKDISISPVTSLYCDNMEANAAGDSAVTSIHTDGWVRFWVVSDGPTPSDPRLKSAFRVGSEITFAARSKNRQFFAFGTSRGVKLIRRDSPDRPLNLPEFRTRIISADFSPDGSLLLLGGIDGRIYELELGAYDLELPDALLNSEVRRYIGHSSVVSGLSFHNSGRIFFSGDWEGNINAWLDYAATYSDISEIERLFGENIVSGSAIRRRSGTGLPVPIEKLMVSSDGQLFFLALNDGVLQGWRVRGFRSLASFKAHNGLIYDLALADSSNRLFTVGRDGLVIKWELAQIPTLPGNPEEYQFESRHSLPLSGIRKICTISEDLLIGADQSGKLQRIEMKQVTSEPIAVEGSL